jgi:hypothetical protein
VRTDATVACWGSNAYGQTSPTPSINVAIAARITSPASATFALGAPGTFTVTTTGTPTSTLTRTGALPAGVTFTDNYNGTATLAGTPAPGTGGDWPITIKAHNSALADAVQTFVLHVPKFPTTISEAPVRIVPSVLGLKVTYTATLTRADSHAPIASQPVTFSAKGAPQCSATTNAQGTATCTTNVLTVLSVFLAGSTTATYAGNGSYLPSSATNPNSLI